MSDEADLIKRYVEGTISETVNTAIPCVIKDVSRLTSDQTIDVLPVIDRVYEDSVILEPSIILNVPVVFPTGGGGIMTFPLQVGDTVLVVFSMRSIEEWLESDGSKQTPKAKRHHHRTDAIAIPGIYTKSTNLSPSATDVEIKFKNQHIVLEPDNTTTITNGVATYVLHPNGDVTLDSPTQVTVTTPLTRFEGNVEATGTITDRVDTTGDSMNNMRDTYNTHTHPGDSGGTTGVPNQTI